MEHLITRELTEPMKQANQANSQKSTGPNTDRGKLNSRCNSWCHGIFGRGALCPWAEELDEDAQDYQRFHHRFQDAFRVRDEVERLLAADMARTQWRLERVLHAESACLAHRRRKFSNDQRRALASEDLGARAALGMLTIQKLGYAGLNESEGKYESILLVLRSVHAMVEEEGYSEEGREFLEGVYGPQPGPGKRLFLADYKALKPPEGGDPATSPQLRQGFLEKLDEEIDKFRTQRDCLRVERGELFEIERDSVLLLPEKAAKIVAAEENRLRHYLQQTFKQLTAWRQAAVRDGPGKAGQTAQEPGQPPVQGGGGVETANGDRAQPSASGSETRGEQEPAPAADADHRAAGTPCTPQAARSET